MALATRQVYLAGTGTGSTPAALVLDFVLPAWLTVGLVPFLYLFSIYVAYDAVFHRIGREDTGRWLRWRSGLALLSVLHFRVGTVRKLAGYWYFTRKLGEARDVLWLQEGWSRNSSTP